MIPAWRKGRRADVRIVCSPRWSCFFFQVYDPKADEEKEDPLIVGWVAALAIRTSTTLTSCQCYARLQN
jgi:hypothetical protein